MSQRDQLSDRIVGQCRFDLATLHEINKSHDGLVAESVEIDRRHEVSGGLLLLYQMRDTHKVFDGDVVDTAVAEKTDHLEKSNR